MLSLIKTALECEPESRFTLVYGNRTVSSIMFLEEIEGLKNRWMERLSIFHVLSEETTDIELLTGLLDRTRIARLCGKAIHVPGIDCAFVCGPAPMMEAAEDALVHAGLERGRIRIERFGSPDAPAAAHVSARANAPRASASDAPGARVTVIIDGKARPITVPFEGASILDTAMAAGIGLPYACKAGVCCTCRARVLEGEVTMDKQYSLEQHELVVEAAGGCRAHDVDQHLACHADAEARAGLVGDDVVEHDAGDDLWDVDQRVDMLAAGQYRRWRRLAAGAFRSAPRRAPPRLPVPEPASIPQTRSARLRRPPHPSPPGR
jgi:ring-1,2-phenylacetyl-CoA epoxidase subunit PaaE